MIKIITNSILMTLPLILSSCLAMGVPQTSNPDQLLAYAMEMSREGRPFRMKQFIDKAYKIYLDNDNQEGLGEAYRFYGKYYRYHKENATIDDGPKIVADNSQQEKSLNNYLKALEIFAEKRNWSSAAVTALEIGQAYDILGDSKLAYDYFNKAEQFYENFLKNKTKQNFPYPTGHFKDFLELIEYERGLVGKG